jgi:hypothetical protein
MNSEDYPKCGFPLRSGAFQKSAYEFVPGAIGKRSYPTHG